MRSKAELIYEGSAFTPYSITLDGLTNDIAKTVYGITLMRTAGVRSSNRLPTKCETAFVINRSSGPPHRQSVPPMPQLRHLRARLSITFTIIPFIASKVCPRNLRQGICLPLFDVVSILAHRCFQGFCELFRRRRNVDQAHSPYGSTTSAMAVETTGRPAARYSGVLVGLISC